MATALTAATTSPAATAVRRRTNVPAGRGQGHSPPGSDLPRLAGRPGPVVVRVVEVAYAVEEALRLIERYEPPAPCHLDVPPRAAIGHGATEAPRGVLFHRYAIDAEGLITSARIVPLTSQNQAGIEDDRSHGPTRNASIRPWRRRRRGSCG